MATPQQPVDNRWKSIPVAPRDDCRIGISFRPRQIEAFGLDGPSTLTTLLAFPFEIVRLGAYWNRIEGPDGAFDTSELDWQLAAVERARRQVLLSLGPVKNFGYPELFVPAHHLKVPLREGSVVLPETHPGLLEAATRFLTAIVGRYRDRTSIFAWQLEHEAVDPLGVEHSWRLGRAFVERELEALRKADPTRPVMMNGFLPMSTVTRLFQGWRTRDQGDSLAIATDLADIVGIDYYPRHALLKVGPRTLYVDGGNRGFEVPTRGKPSIVSEGQAEPWETATTPPNPRQRTAFTCGPHHLIENFNTAVRSAKPRAYLFWGAEYWVLRDRSGDPTYLQAFSRVLE